MHAISTGPLYTQWPYTSRAMGVTCALCLIFPYGRSHITCSFSIVLRPIITTDPDDQQDVQPGADVTFFCDASGEDLTYSWFKDTVLLTDSEDEISGATTDTLSVLDAMDPSDEGFYYCRVVNDAGMASSSPTAGQLTISTLLVTIIIWQRLYTHTQ